MSNVEKYCSGIGIVNQVGSSSIDKNCKVPSPNQLTALEGILYLTLVIWCVKTYFI